MKIYVLFKKELKKNYYIGTFIAFVGLIIGLNVVNHSINVQDYYYLAIMIAYSIVIMTVTDFLIYKRYFSPIKKVFFNDISTVEELQRAYLQIHRLPSLSGYRILGPRLLGLIIPLSISFIIGIEKELLSISYDFVFYMIIGVIIVFGVHAMVEFFLTSNMIRPVIIQLKRMAQKQHNHKLSLNGKIIISIRTKFLMSSFLIGAFPLLLFGLVTRIQLSQLSTVASEKYLIWGFISLTVSFALGSYGAWLLYSYFKNPLTQLNEKIKQVKAGNLEVEAYDFYSDEFSKVIAGFNHMVRNLRQKEAKNQQLIESFFTTLATILDARDHYTAGHSVRVAYYSVEIGKKYGLNKDQLVILKQSALLHDIGKIGVPDEILLKEEALTDDEYDQIKTHSTLGEQIMKSINPQEMIEPLLPGIRYHHERIDGQGYPDGLTGSNIPLHGRIIAIADAFDAMTSDRPYRKGMDMDGAIKILNEGKGKQWDYYITELFIEWLNENKNIKLEI